MEGTNTDGSRTVDGAQPWFYVTDVAFSVYNGQIVNKVGRTTGWTSGHIDVTCADLAIDSYFAVRCANRTFMWAGTGDSGGPAFARNGGGADSTVTLFGTMFYLEHGSPGSDNLLRSNTSWFSSYRAFESDLGVLDQRFLNPRSAVPANLSALVEGPDYVTSGYTNTWRASVSGGVPPYSYQWSGAFNATTSEVTGSLTYTDDLFLSVTDAAGRVVYASKHITVCTTGITC